MAYMPEFIEILKKSWKSLTLKSVIFPLQLAFFGIYYSMMLCSCCRHTHVTVVIHADNFKNASPVYLRQNEERERNKVL